MNKKIAIVGMQQAGKDTLAELWGGQFNARYISSSEYANEKFIFDMLKDKYGYKTHLDCYIDRVNHRDEWYELITQYNYYDRTKLAREILAENDFYVGMRNFEELQACIIAELFDLIVWVDASMRIPPESTSSFTLLQQQAHIIIQNNHTLDFFAEKALKLGEMIFNNKV